jgi:hypothetical protein
VHRLHLLHLGCRLTQERQQRLGLGLGEVQRVIQLPRRDFFMQRSNIAVGLANSQGRGDETN